MREQERMAVSQDTEITLGAGKLLGLFFSLVILCGVSLGVGYWLGRNSTKQSPGAASLAQTMTASAQAPAAAKPGASQLAAQPVAAKPADCTTDDSCPPQTAAPSGTDLTFYQAVQQKEEHPQLDPAPAQQPASNTSAPPAASKAQSTLGNGYVVQIAAVRNQDDARLLSDALRKQQYPVLVSQPGDRLFHVQVGPYADIKEAEAIRARLVSAGYNPYLKH